MFAHVVVHASDRAVSSRFYDVVLATLGIRCTGDDDRSSRWQDFWVAEAGEEQPVTRRLHVGFVAPGRAEVDEFWRAGVEAGYRDDGEPGPRTQYRDDYYGAFLLDPDGNSAEAVHHGALRTGAAIDHLWIRVADIAAATRFYETVAPRAGFRLRLATPDRVRFGANPGSFSLVAGARPTENVQMAFPATVPGDPGAHLRDPDGNLASILP